MGFFLYLFMFFYKFLFFLPDFLEIQRKSFHLFLNFQLGEEFSKISQTQFQILYKNYKFLPPPLSIEKSILSSKSYCCHFFFPIQYKQIVQWIFLGTLPLLTRRGHFLINGTPRILLNQILRSPGIYFFNKGSSAYADIISQRGPWMRLAMDSKKKMWICCQFQQIPAASFFQNLTTPYFDYQFFLKQKKNSRIAFLLNDFQSHFQSLDLTISFLGQTGRTRLNKRLGLSLKALTLTPIDFLKISDILLTGQFVSDDFDDLKNRRLKTIGEFLQDQLEIGLQSFQKSSSPSQPINSLFINSSFKEFFHSHQLSQFLDQSNPLAEITHKRRLSYLSAGGLPGMEIRGIHITYFGRICPIETPEGQNAGLVNSLAAGAHVNNKGFLETPFVILYKEHFQNQRKLTLFSSEDQEKENVFFSQKFPKFKKTSVTALQRKKFQKCALDLINLCAVNPQQFLSIATTSIPFIEHDDANRALMGSNMQRQALPLITCEQPMVTSLNTFRILSDLKDIPTSSQSGILLYSSRQKTSFFSFEKKVTERVFFQNFEKSNQNTYFFERPISYPQNWVQKGDLLGDCSASQKGELALGQNLFVAYLPWEGLNFEDAVLVNQKVVSKYTSLHIEKYDIELFDQLKVENEIQIGSWVEEGDILIDQRSEMAIQPTLLTHEKLLYDIVGEKKAPKKQGPFWRVPHGVAGRIIRISKSIIDETETTVRKITLYIAIKREFKVGDKISGRHGNKGIISKILANSDMPYLSNGQSIEIVLNPLGVPSRMNVGQIFECLLGLAGEIFHTKFQVLCFDEMYGYEASRSFVYSKLFESCKKKRLFSKLTPGKLHLFDGRNGQLFHQSVLVGSTYIMKLIHLVDEKIHGRATGPYSLITQQPLRGRAHHGGQRFGEMEVWAAQGFGSAYTLQELLTVKSDDMIGRNLLMETLLKNKPLRSFGTPESLRVVLRELQCLCLQLTNSI